MINSVLFLIFKYICVYSTEHLDCFIVLQYVYANTQISEVLEHGIDA